MQPRLASQASLPALSLLPAEQLACTPFPVAIQKKKSLFFKWPFSGATRENKEWIPVLFSACTVSCGRVEFGLNHSR